MTTSSNLHVLHPLPKRGARRCGPDPAGIPWRLMPRKGFHNLLCGPRGGGMFGDMNVDDPSSLVGQNYEDKEYFVGDRRHDKEIQATRSCTWSLKRSSRGRRRPRRSDAITSPTVDLATSMPSMRTSPTNTWGAPGRIGLPHGADQISDVLRNRGRPGVPRWLSRLQ